MNATGVPVEYTPGLLSANNAHFFKGILPGHPGESDVRSILPREHSLKSVTLSCVAEFSFEHLPTMSISNGNDHHHDKDDSHAGLVPQEAMTVGSLSMEQPFEMAYRIRSIRVARRMRFLTCMAAIGGFLFGYDTGVISGAMLPIKRTFDLTPWQQEVVVSSTIFSAFVSSLCGGSINRKLGRRITILFAAGVFTLGSLLLGVSWGYKSLVVGRIIVGIGIGAASLTTPIYLAEVAVPHMRGQLVTLNALLVTMGQFIAGMVDGVFDKFFPDQGWRWMLGLAAIPSTIMLVGFLNLPESPRWLAMNGHSQKALAVLEMIRNSEEEARDELREIVNALPLGAGAESAEDAGDYGTPSHDDEITREPDDSNFFQQVADMMSDAPTRAALFLGCGLMALQQLCGINTVMVRVKAAL